MKQQNTVHMLVGLVLLLMIGLGVCDNATEGDCPLLFDKVEGIPDRCFFYYEGPTGGALEYYVTFPEALEVCKGKDAKVFEPQAFEEGMIIYYYMAEKRGIDLGWSSVYQSMWINYKDIEVNSFVSFVGELGESVRDSVSFVSSTYMGSLSTLGKLPKEWWIYHNTEGFRDNGEHCAYWIPYEDNRGVGDVPCYWHLPLVCESPLIPKSE